MQRIKMQKMKSLLKDDNHWDSMLAEAALYYTGYDGHVSASLNVGSPVIWLRYLKPPRPCNDTRLVIK